LSARSGNPAVGRVGPERVLHQPLPGSAGLKIAAGVGSDVPLFLIGGAVLGLGRGEQVYPMPDLPETHCVVALPNVGVSTPQAFRDWDLRHTESLTGEPSSDRLKVLSRALSACLCEPHSSGVFSSGEDRPGNPLLALVRTGIENDFEEVVFHQHPSLGDIKRILVCSDQPEQSALYAAL